MRKRNLRRLLAMILALVMTVGLGMLQVNAEKTNEQGAQGVTWEELDPSDVSATLFGKGGSAIKDSEPPYKDTDTVRAIIVFEDVNPVAPAEIAAIGGDTLIKEYAGTMNIVQAVTASRISRDALDGEKMDVVWSFDTVTNAISVNVQYGKLDDIAAVPGVKSVFMERRYEMLDEADNLTSQQMTGADGVKSGETGYFGAGTSVAVIDTGLTVDHIAFDPDAFEYALREDAESAGKSYEEYVQGLDLITRDTIASHLKELHAYERDNTLTADDLYRNAKVPFAFNYNTGSVDVSHATGGEGNEHGSHVAGIAAANRYLPAEKVYDMDGDEDFDVDDAQRLLDMAVRGEKVENPAYTDIDSDGALTAYDAYLMLIRTREEGVAEYVSAAESVRVDGVAPEAQLLAMAVFDSTGGTYSSDYIAALEDAVTLGIDVTNLSLGSPQPGYSESHMEYARGAMPDENGNVPLIDEWIDGVFEKAVEAGMVVSISAGNSGNWADEDNAYNLMYADEGGVGNLGAPGSLADAFTVASADNTGLTATNSTVASNGAGDKTVTIRPSDFSGAPTAWSSLDPDGFGTEYEYVFLGDPTELLNGGTQTDESVYAGDVTDFDGADFQGKIAVVARGNMVNFITKHENAQAAGAIAVIVFNNEPGELSGTVSGGVGADGTVTPDTTAEIPIVGISMADGLALLGVSDKSGDGVFSGKLDVINRVTLIEAGEDAKANMSSFSSWGTTGDLKIKPEITAPGGAIMSVNGAEGNTTSYELMSGTSMSSPHNAGLAALGVDYVTANGGEVLTKAQALQPGITAGALVQSLLMSTAQPLMEGEYEYSVRNQGAGLANIQSAVNAGSFITVKDADTGKVKAELGDGTEFAFTFTVNNLTDEELTYDLDQSVLTPDVINEDGNQLTADEMTALGATVTYTGAEGGKVTVPAGGKADVTVNIAIPADVAADMEAKGFTNGFYVEGYIYLTGSDVTHSIPMLGWYGSWLDPSMYDVNSITELFYGNEMRPSHINAVAKNELTYAPVGSEQGIDYSGNIYNINAAAGYSDKSYLEDRNSFNDTDPKWEFIAVFPTLIRSAKDFDLYITGVTEDGKADLDKIYYEDETYTNFDRSLLASFYYVSAGQWYDATADYGIGIEWDMTDPATGSKLPEGEKIMISFVAVPEYGTDDPDYALEEQTGERSTDLTKYLGNPGSTLSWTFTVDNTAPKIVDKGADTFKLTADNKLTLEVQDNRYVAAVVVLDGAASEAIEYYYPDMIDEGGSKTVTVELDTYRRQFGDKVVIAVCDYAGNETYYGVNLNGDGEPYGEFVGFQFDGWGGSKWVSFDKDVNRDETSVFACEDVEFTAAEYVNGMVFAQTEDGKLYGINYKDMLGNKASLDQSYITTLTNVYADFAYNYADGLLYGIYSYEDSYGYGTTIDAIHLTPGTGYDDWGDEIEIPAYTVETDLSVRQDMVGYTISADDDGNLYVLALTDDEDWELSETAHLWRMYPVENMGYVSWRGEDMGDTGLTLNYLQSAAWNHNDETLYWARFIPAGVLSVTAELYKVDVTNAACTKVGTLSDETAGIFAPLSAEAAAKDEHLNVPEVDPDAYGRPIFTANALTMNVNGTTTLSWYFDPWYAAHKDVKLSSSDTGVVTVDENGVVNAVGTGVATVTVCNADDETLYSECQISVASISAEIKGYVAYRGGSSQQYTFKIDNGVPSIEYGNMFTAQGDLAGFGTKLSASAQKGDTVWAAEWGESGNIYSIDAQGNALTYEEPIDGDMMFGLAYSEDIDKFSGIMNFYIYADVPLPTTEEVRQEMLDSYDEKANQFNWHRLDMSPWLNESQGTLVTQEESTITKIVFCGITSMPGMPVQSAQGGVFGGIYGSYTPDTTWVLLDNVGRLWYIDELTGVTKSYDEGYEMYVLKNEDDMLQDMGMGQSDIIELPYDDGSYSLFVVREIVETTLYDRFLDGDLGITYNFSDIHYAGQIGITDEGAGDGVFTSPMFFFSLYDYWGESKYNELYLYVQNRVWEGNDENYMPVYSKGSLYELGNTGTDYIIATINTAEYKGGLEETNIPVVFHPGEELAGESDRTVYLSADSFTLPDADAFAYGYSYVDWDVPDSLSFDYWTDNNGDVVYETPELTRGLEFTAHWKVRHSIIFHPGAELEALGFESATVYPGEYYSLPQSEYQFRQLGWEIPEDLALDHWEDANGDTVYYIDELTEDIELTAVWKHLTAIVFHPGQELEEYGNSDVTRYFDPDTFSYYELPNEYSFEYDFGWTVPTNFTFTGWKDSDGSLIDDSFILTADGAELTAGWELRQLSDDTSIASIAYWYYDENYDRTVYYAVEGVDGSWTMTLDPGVTMPEASDLRIILNDDYAECDRWGGDVTGPVNGVFQITVHAEDGSQQTYTLTVTYEEA